METEDKHSKQREITYQIGWKKGKIQWNDSDHAAADANPDPLLSSKLFRLHLRYFWRTAPSFPNSWVILLLYLLPVLCFLLTIVLVYNLRNP